ncbi:DUF3093 domain-containing protein [Corynebacterium suicordis]|uniref:DUF3093 domain-containing protein n=1 Tax=Corynebacterium suicordis DSM 45110 TaxID=1121369 RepID=A0ABR9ZJ96_9CORY|nr:DUF3093 domain-containing protein [Corynebacterium suicordis]MBF4553495.1 DUF3093 domain-containing protein [Corynebacterium suicordis DSM 45110]MDR6277531.1 hypothetical protein [Corynebacterium suicordis]
MPTTEPRPAQQSEILYKESQRVPLAWWLLGAMFVALISWQAQMQREWYWGVVAGILSAAAIGWSLISLSSNKLTVVRADGETWLYAGAAKLPADVISRTLVIPPTAKDAAMGRQLDPAAYVIHKSWIPTMAMLVLDDPDDPTPYWLISSKEPQELLEAIGRPIY